MRYYSIVNRKGERRWKVREKWEGRGGHLIHLKRLMGTDFSQRKENQQVTK